ncbi:hypothetical protein PIB30_036304 [Stylosanthes scabra]|uniref:BED-type domain-containing protein n=1 Tax=Stylosanthes scabra TaxID=79078 RepID=A0ABU6RDK2_9FABA|nr:hypothetical protein [Stylosanthes scabra]
MGFPVRNKCPKLNSDIYLIPRVITRELCKESKLVAGTMAGGPPASTGSRDVSLCPTWKQRPHSAYYSRRSAVANETLNLNHFSTPPQWVKDSHFSNPPLTIHKDSPLTDSLVAAAQAVAAAVAFSVGGGSSCHPSPVTTPHRLARATSKLRNGNRSSHSLLHPSPVTSPSLSLEPHPHSLSLSSSPTGHRVILAKMESETTVKVPADTCTEIESQVDADAPTAKRVRPLTSDVWNFFKKSGKDKDGADLAECKGCKKVFKAGGKRYGTSSIKRHLNVCTHIKHEDIGQTIQEMQNKLGGA